MVQDHTGSLADQLEKIENLLRWENPHNTWLVVKIIIVVTIATILLPFNWLCILAQVQFGIQPHLCFACSLLLLLCPCPHPITLPYPSCLQYLLLSVVQADRQCATHEPSTIPSSNPISPTAAACPTARLRLQVFHRRRHLSAVSAYESQV